MKELIPLRSWALAIIIAPTVVIGLLLGGYLTYKRYTELDQNLIDRGIFLSEPLTFLSANAIQNYQQKELGEAIEAAHLRASPIVKSISIFLPNHQLFVSSNVHTDYDKVRLKPGKILADNTSVEVTEDNIYVRSPIYGEDIDSTSFVFIKRNGKTLYGYLVVEMSRDRAELEQQSSIIILSILLILAIGVTIIFAVSFIRNIVNPITKINNTMTRIAKGDLKARLGDSMLGELDTLRLGVNSVAKSIHVANERAEHSIGEHTQELQQTVELLEVQNVQLSLARRDAQDANEVKSQFLANMSHELRTPLNGVLGFTRQLRKTPLNVNQKDFVDTIESSANNLLRIINDILDFSKLEADKMVLEFIPFSVRDVINDVMSLMAPAVFDKGLEFHLNIDARVPEELQGDPTRLKQIIINLIGNAIKFTQKGYVRLDVKHLGSNTNGQHIKFSVTDTGVGIEHHKQEKLFAAFGQADSSTTRKFGGTGLGLIISKKLVEAMDGGIQFNSRLGHGSEFFFDIYLPESSSGAVQPVMTSVLEQKKVLFFDRNAQSYADISSLLKEYGELIVTATTTAEEFEKALSIERFDIVFVGCQVTASNVNEAKAIVSKAKQHCANVFAIINSISPNMKEVMVNSGALHCFSMPANHRRVLNAFAELYLTPEIEIKANADDFSGMKVLAVDDMPANLKLIETLLEELNISTTLATDGAQALQMAQKQSFDMIFMDLQMPIMDGITSCTRIKEASLNETTPIVAVTAHVGDEEKQKMEQASFTDVLTKPIDEEMLKQVILDACPNCRVTTSPVNSQTSTVKPVAQGSKLPPDLEKHNLIDWPLALSRANNKPDLAADLLGMFIKNLPENKQNMSLYFEQKQLEPLLQLVHKFHGACCYTGVPKFRELAHTIEVELKRSKSIENIEPELLELIDEMSNLIEDSSDWFDNHKAS